MTELSLLEQKSIKYKIADKLASNPAATKAGDLAVLHNGIYYIPIKKKEQLTDIDILREDFDIGVIEWN